jgi:hypothetical protein
MDVESCIIDELGEKLANEMDQHILIGFMLELGWSEITVDPWVHNSTSEINRWVKANIQGHVMHSGNRWVFEQQKDATIFALRWS